MLDNNAIDQQLLDGFSINIVPVSHQQLMRNLVTVSSGIISVQPEDLRVYDGFNPRHDSEALRAHIRSIADSIISEGYYLDKPMAGFAGFEGKKPVIYVTEGGCRLQATLLAIQDGAQLTEVPVALKSKATSMEDLVVALVRGNEYKAFTPIELAICCKRLANYNWPTPRIAQSFGISPEYVSQLLTLAGAPKIIRDKVISGEFTAAVALQALRDHGGDAADVLTDALAKAQAEGKTKLTSRYMPEQIRKKAIVKSAPKMYEAIEQVRAHAAFNQLPADLQELIATIIEKMPVAVDAGQSEDKESAKQNELVLGTV